MFFFFCYIYIMLHYVQGGEIYNGLVLRKWEETFVGTHNRSVGLNNQLFLLCDQDKNRQIGLF